jgi:hypothetical protein
MGLEEPRSLACDSNRLGTDYLFGALESRHDIPDQFLVGPELVDRVRHGEDEPSPESISGGDDAGYERLARYEMRDPSESGRKVAFNILPRPWIDRKNAVELENSAQRHNGQHWPAKDDHGKPQDLPRQSLAIYNDHLLLSVHHVPFIIRLKEKYRINLTPFTLIFYFFLPIAKAQFGHPNEESRHISMAALVVNGPNPINKLRFRSVSWTRRYSGVLQYRRCDSNGAFSSNQPNRPVM